MISVVIPTYEQKGFGPAMLEDLLYSIQFQVISYPFEICISDNCVGKSPILQTCLKFPLLPINYKYNPICGASENINSAIDMAQYPMIKIMCQDDVFLHRHAMEMFVDKLEGYGWVISDSIRLTEGGVGTGYHKTKYDPNQFEKNTTGMPSVIGFRKCDLRFNCKLKTFCDLYFYYQLYELYGAPGVIHTPTIGQRYWHGSLSRNQEPSHDVDRKYLRDNNLIKC